MLSMVGSTGDLVSRKMRALQTRKRGGLSCCFVYELIGKVSVKQ